MSALIPISNQERVIERAQSSLPNFAPSRKRASDTALTFLRIYGCYQIRRELFTLLERTFLGCRRIDALNETTSPVER
jgi:hypothetical protein